MKRRHDIVQQFNDLIAVFVNSESELLAAVEDAGYFASYAEFERDADRRRLAIRELQTLVRRLGGEPNIGGTFMGQLRESYRHLVRVRRQSDAQICRLIARDDRRLKAAIGSIASDRQIPEAIRSKLVRIWNDLTDEVLRIETVDIQIEGTMNWKQ